MSIGKRLLNSAVTGLGVAVGARAGNDLYDGAKRALKQVDWKGLGDKASAMAGQATETLREAGDRVVSAVSADPAKADPVKDESEREKARQELERELDTINAGERKV